MVKKVCKWIIELDYNDKGMKRIRIVFVSFALSELVRITQNGFYCLQ